MELKDFLKRTDLDIEFFYSEEFDEMFNKAKREQKIEIYLHILDGYYNLSDTNNEEISDFLADESFLDLRQDIFNSVKSEKIDDIEEPEEIINPTLDEYIEWEDDPDRFNKDGGRIWRF